ncbi:MAG TPA: hypothetical protein VGG96_01970 [Steroidobacteraceae bacterium]
MPEGSLAADPSWVQEAEKVETAEKIEKVGEQARCRELQPRPRLLLPAFVYLSYLFATFQFLRAYFFLVTPDLNAAKYEAGTEKLPFQARMLLSVVMRHATQSPLLTRMAAHVRGTLHAPDVLALAIIDCFALLLMAVVVRAFYCHLSPAGRLPWMPYCLLLWMLSATYIVRFQEDIYFPYDLLAASLFTLCIYLSYRRLYLPLLPVFCLACFNRETILMIVPLLLINGLVRPRPVRGRWKELAAATFMFAFWIAAQHYVHHRYAHNPSDLRIRIDSNLQFLARPQIWSQIASGGGFLLPLPFLCWRFLPEPRLRAYALLIPAWVAIMCLVGLLPESRIFGELLGLLAVLCTVLFERGYGVRGALSNPAK